MSNAIPVKNKVIDFVSKVISIVIFGYGIDEEEERNCGLSFITVLKTYQYQQDTAR